MQKLFITKDIIIKSAGTEAQGVNANAIKVMADISIPISHHQSKKVNLIKLLTELLNDLAFSYLNLPSHNSIIIPEWKLLINTLNQKVIISLNDVDYIGTATDIFEDGSLKLTLLDGSHKHFFDCKLRYLK